MKTVDIMSHKWQPRHKAYTETIRYIQGRKSGEIKSLVTPWDSFNRATLGGIQWGDALLMAARPGIGKSLWADQLINESFILNPKQKFRVLKWEMEMSGVATIIRELSAHLGKSYQYLCSAAREIDGELSNEEIAQCIKYLGERVKRNESGDRLHPIDIISDTGTVEEFEQTCEAYINIHPKENILIPVDHVRLFDGENDQIMLNKLAKAVIRMKKVDRSNKAIFILLTHLNRNVTTPERCEEGEIGNYVVEADLYGSDHLLQAADIVMAMDRPAKRNIRYYGPSRYIIEDRTLVCQNIKVRNGDTGISFYEAQYEKMRIVEIGEPAKAVARDDRRRKATEENVQNKKPDQSDQLSVKF